MKRGEKRALGEYWERVFCDMARQEGWETRQRSQTGTYAYDVALWHPARRLSWRAEIKHKDPWMHEGEAFFGYEDYRIDRLRPQTLYVIHNYQCQSGATRDARCANTSNVRSHWIAQWFYVLLSGTFIQRQQPSYRGSKNEGTAMMNVRLFPLSAFRALDVFLLGQQ